MRSEVMQAINTGHPFTLEFVTADRRRGTGGELIKVEKWKKVMTTTADAENIRPGHFAKAGTNLSKHPDHLAHDTFNIFNPANRGDYPRKVHYWLMISYNGKTIING
jgi:hypothetical protein